MGVHTVDEWERSLGRGGVRPRSGRAPPSPSPASLTPPPLSWGLTMPVSDVKMTISYRGASCWNKVSMPGRFLNLQPVASWGGSEGSEGGEDGETPRPRSPPAPPRMKPQPGGGRYSQNCRALLHLCSSWGLRSTRL